MQFSILHIEHPAAESTRLRNDHSVGVAIFQFHRRRDRVGAVLHVNKGVFGHASHARIDRQ